MAKQLTEREELIHAMADYEELRASTRNKLEWIARDLAEAQRALARDEVSKDKRLRIAQYIDQRLGVLDEVIQKLEQAKK